MWKTRQYIVKWKLLISETFRRNSTIYYQPFLLLPIGFCVIKQFSVIKVLILLIEAWLTYIKSSQSVENQLRCLVVQYICHNMHLLNRFLAVCTCLWKFVKPIVENVFLPYTLNISESMEFSHIFGGYVKENVCLKWVEVKISRPEPFWK